MEVWNWKCCLKSHFISIVQINELTSKPICSDVKTSLMNSHLGKKFIAKLSFPSCHLAWAKKFIAELYSAKNFIAELSPRLKEKKKVHCWMVLQGTKVHCWNVTKISPRLKTKSSSLNCPFPSCHLLNSPLYL